MNDDCNLSDQDGWCYTHGAPEGFCRYPVFETVEEADAWCSKRRRDNVYDRMMKDMVSVTAATVGFQRSFAFTAEEFNKIIATFTES